MILLLPVCARAHTHAHTRSPQTHIHARAARTHAHTHTHTHTHTLTHTVLPPSFRDANSVPCVPPLSVSLLIPDDSRAHMHHLHSTRLCAAAGLGSYVKRDKAVPKEVLLAAAKAACAETARDDEEVDDDGEAAM